MQTAEQIINGPGRVQCERLKANISVENCRARHAKALELMNPDKPRKRWTPRIESQFLVEACGKCEVGKKYDLR